MLLSKSVKPFQQANQKMHQFSEPEQTKQEITNTCLEAAPAPYISARKCSWGVRPPSFLPCVQGHPLDFPSPSWDHWGDHSNPNRNKITWRKGLGGKHGGEKFREGSRLASLLTRGLKPPPFLFYLQITSDFQKGIRVWHFSGNKSFNWHRNKKFLLDLERCRAD